MDARLLDQWLTRDVVRTAIGLNTWQGVEYVDRDAFARMLGWAVRLDAVDAAPPVAGAASLSGSRPAAPGAAETEPRTDLVRRLTDAAEAAGYRIDRLRASLTPPTKASARTRSRTPKGPEA